MLKEKRKKLSKKQRGFALVASLLVSAAVLILIGALFFRLSSGTKDATAEAQRKAALAVAEEGSSHIMNLIAAENTPAAGKDAASAAARDALKKKDGCAFLLGNDDACNQQSVAAFFADASVQAEGLTAGTGFGIEKTASGSVKVGPLKAASGEGEFDVESVEGTVDASGTKGYNELKVQITSYVPNKANPTSVRKFEAIYHRVFPGNAAPTSAPATPTPVATATPTPTPTATPTAAPTATPRATATPAGKDKGNGKSNGKDKGNGKSNGKDKGSKSGGKSGGKNSGNKNGH